LEFDERKLAPKGSKLEIKYFDAASYKYFFNNYINMKRYSCPIKAERRKSFKTTSYQLRI